MKLYYRRIIGVLLLYYYRIIIVLLSYSDKVVLSALHNLLYQSYS